MAQVSGTKSPGRNALCSCGSGKKFKKCCEGKRTFARSSWPWKTGGLVAAAALVIVPIAVIKANAGKSNGTSGPAAPSVSSQTPTAWQYDPEKDRYWSPEHGHWYPGPPPVEPIDFFADTNPPAATGAGTGASGTTPAPWQYDPQTNRHWHRQHGHWHNGRPPPQSQRPPP